LFDPFTTDRLAVALDELDMLPQHVVFSPSSDPLPPLREVRSETLKAVQLLLSREVVVQIMTRGRFSPAMFETLASHRERVKVAIAITTLDKSLCRVLEPRAASPHGRVADIARLISAGVDVDARLEPLIPGRTDTRQNLAPLFDSLARAGVRRIVAHYLYLNNSVSDTLNAAIASLGWVERLRDDFDGGRVFRLGTVGPTKHLPLEIRRAGLARMIALGAEFGLTVTTGSSQNPDLPRLG
jgi:DNA repair photolyase